MVSLSDVEVEDRLSIDPDRGWFFDNEDELFDFFQSDITKVESSFKEVQKNALSEEASSTLEFTLERPDQIWVDNAFFKDDRSLWLFIKDHGDKKELVFCHCYKKEPTFIYYYASVKNNFNFSENEDELEPASKKTSTEEPPTKAKKKSQDKAPSESTIKPSNDEFKNFSLFKEFSRGASGSASVPYGALDGDSLVEGDELAVGLYKAMMTLRNGDDLLETDFQDFSDMREPAIEEADEIWRTMDSYGNHLVHFVKEFEYTNDIETEILYYVVVTVEDTVSESNVLLFSFPTFDESLVDRYRVGENLQSEEVIQEGSH